MAVRVRPLVQDDFAAWLPLWDGNNDGQRDMDVTSQTWARLMDSNSAVFGFGAEDSGCLIGLVHYILHPTTGSMGDACYMQDVYVDPAVRGKGAGRKLVEAVAAQGKKEGWARLYWIAEADNEAAQALYKDFGVKLNFTVHAMIVK